RITERLLDPRLLPLCFGLKPAVNECWKDHGLEKSLLKNSIDQETGF
ncbi:hypothetical protein AVEN_57243-1, partial [Araneus ventricosus]